MSSPAKTKLPNLKKRTLRELESSLRNEGIEPLSIYKPVDPTVPVKTIPGILRGPMMYMIEAITVHYVEYRTYPTPQELFDYVHPLEPNMTLGLAHHVWRVQPFLELLYSRGLPPVESLTVKKQDPHVVTSIQLSQALDPRQLLALSVMTDTSQRLSFETRLRRAGVTKQEWQNWMRNTKFRTKFENIAREVFVRAQSSIDLQLASGALEGKLDFIKYYNEVTGRHDPKTRARADVQQILNAVVDIITRNVTDAAVLSRISSELSAELVKLEL